ncbi:MAG: NAD(P)H-quinone oxidoreductase [Deltaproteobacteria bacterium]|nr:NAD(P)H-quinone oxidoreductase [Deltaproteobacteria bacterium]
MRAICIREPGDVDVLEMREVVEPEPGPFEIRVAVRAAGLNRADLLQRRGLYPPPPDAPADIPGLEFAGEVEALGAKATRFQVGEPVMGIVGGGAYAEKVVLHERAAMRVPSGMELAQAAAIPESFMTAFDGLLRQGELKPGERLLVHAVASGVGTAAVQVGRLVGASVLGTSRSADKLARCRVLGLDVALHLEEPRFADEVRHATGGAGVDVVLDLVGGSYLEESVAALAPRGRLVVVGLLAGNLGKLPLGLLLTRRLTIRGTVLRSRPLEEKIELAQAFERQMLPQFESRRLVPVLDEAMSVAEVRRAHQRMEANATLGKIVLTW